MSMLADLYLLAAGRLESATLSDALAGADERRARRQRRLSALVEQCRRLRQQLHGVQRADLAMVSRIANLEAALRDIANEQECTNLYACQRRARQALGER